ncbi:MAG: DNA polymerase beta superfamily protein [Anaerobacillus sp.]|uniref:DNA polymerase beta superfamily protein n=1 Tax=Anaerobacillus sp. TaxID=1872506 RepID=UPI003918F6AC
MRKVIFQQLREIENEHQVKIVFACEVGSRATGLETESSDYDVRFIYIRPIQSYLSIHKKSDVISMPINDQLDLHGWGSP